MSDAEIREAERAGDLARVQRLRARKGEGPVWRAADGRLLAPHQLETGHLINVLKLMVRRFFMKGRHEGDKPWKPDDEIAAFADFERERHEFVLELEGRGAAFDLGRWFRDRAEGWCEVCPHPAWRRKKGVRAVGSVLTFTCERCAARKEREHGA